MRLRTDFCLHTKGQLLQIPAVSEAHLSSWMATHVYVLLKYATRCVGFGTEDCRLREAPTTTTLRRYKNARRPLSLIGNERLSVIIM